MGVGLVLMSSFVCVQLNTVVCRSAPRARRLEWFSKSMEGGLKLSPYGEWRNINMVCVNIGMYSNILGIYRFLCWCSLCELHGYLFLSCFLLFLFSLWVGVNSFFSCAVHFPHSSE